MIYKRGETWWCGFYVDGKKQRESAKTGDEETAKKYLRRRMKEVHAHECDTAKPFITQRDRRRTIADLVDALKRDLELRGKKTAQSKSNLARVSNDFGAFRALNLTAEDVDEYIERRLAEGYAKASINRATQLLHQAYVLAELASTTHPPIIGEGQRAQGFLL